MNREKYRKQTKTEHKMNCIDTSNAVPIISHYISLLYSFHFQARDSPPQLNEVFLFKIQKKKFSNVAPILNRIYVDRKLD